MFWISEHVKFMILRSSDLGGSICKVHANTLKWENMSQAFQLSGSKSKVMQNSSINNLI